jgi:gas vesicle protein
MHDDDYDDEAGASSIVLAFLLGGLTGAAVALLYAPRSGRETREMLTERMREGEARARELKEAAVRRGREAIDEAADYVERQRENLERRKERFAAAVEAGRQTYKEETQKAPTTT